MSDIDFNKLSKTEREIYFQQLHYDISNIIYNIRSLIPKEDIEDITLYNESNEFGVALEVICAHISQDKLPIEENIKSKILRIADRMGLQIECEI